jgi:hypothetical protein
MNYNEVLEKAKTTIGSKCRVCSECNGVACRGELPGMGGKGTGSSFMDNYKRLKDIKLNMDTIYEFRDIDTSIKLFGKRFEFPVFAAPIGGLGVHYSGYYNDFLQFADKAIRLHECPLMRLHFMKPYTP